MTDASELPQPGPWGPRTLEDGETQEVRLGPLRLHLAREGDEFQTAHVRDPLPGTADSADEEERDWSRGAARDWSGEVTLRPSFPDRPLVVAPDDPFHLLGGADARIYVRVPLWADVEMGGGRGRTRVATLPTIPFSDTWWGTVEEGELSYWLTTHARRRVTAELFEPHLAMCPLRLVNRSDELLTVDKIALRVDYLGLYTDGGRIWSDETRVRYQGDAEGSRLEMAGEPPAEAPEADLLAPPRLRMGRGFRARTFGRIRSIQGWMA